MGSHTRKANIQRGKESSNVTSRLDAFLARHENRVIVLLCVLAAARVFLFSAAYPPFNNIDEAQHFDLVWRYAKGMVPDHLSHYMDCTSGLLSTYYTPEYIYGPDHFPDGEIPPPVWSLHSPIRQKCQYALRVVWNSRVNTEATQPPVYYAVGAVWHWIGSLTGVRGVFLLYWARFMNVWVVGLLVWCSYCFIRRLFPESLNLRIGVPLMLAFLPQDAFYSVTNDALSALPFCLCFFCLLELHRDGPKGYAWCVLTGVSAAAAFLVKYSNVAILVLLAAAVVLAALRLRKSNRLREGLPKLIVILVACLAPVMAWLVRDCAVLHDITGSMEKTRCLTWTPRPLGEILAHPIFSAYGAIHFVRDLIVNFWRGETLWHSTPLASPWADVLYRITTLVLLPAALIGGWLRRTKDSAEERYADLAGALVLAVSVAFLVLVSVLFDFGNCPNPSREHPYVISGRLIIGCIVPFLFLYVRGLDFVMSVLRIRWSRIAVLAVIAAAITVSEVSISIGVFESAYNWFRLIGS